MNRDLRQKSLFSQEAPLAESERPSGFDGFEGQEHAVARVMAFLSGRRTPSVLFYGPPGCGKSSLALLMARKSGLPYERISAPEAGIATLREVMARVKILVLDEIHRFSKAQQDFFLPFVERGDIILLASTTENPSFSVTRQLLSRMHAIRMDPLPMESLKKIALRGAAREGLRDKEELLDFICRQSGGDARTLLALVELAGTIKDPDIAKMKEIIPERLMRHDRDGDSHYEIISALIKSIRGSDPDAALYWLAALISGGEDPLFICRRLCISAAEDIGLADPGALSVADSCFSIVEKIGMPEGRIPMAETTVYLAMAPKSNTAYKALDRAIADIRENGAAPVPLHLRNAVTDLQRENGFHENYLYPHDYEGGWVSQTYIPEGIGPFFMAGKNGMEENMVAAWRKRRGEV